MRTFTTLTFLAASFFQFTLVRGEDSLFSEVAMESVFEKNTPLTANVASLSDGEKLERITGPSSLMLALKFAGFAPKQTENRVAVQVEHAGWKLPVSMEVELELDRIVCEMSLVELPDASTIDSNALLKLLEKNDAIGGYFFAYDAKTKLIQLRSSFSNRSITAKQLKSNLIQIAVFADKHSDLWTKLKTAVAAKTASTAKTTTVTSSKPVASVPAVVPVQLSSLVGIWGATAKTGESIAIQIGTDSSFKLATVKAGKSSISKGKATLNGNKLTLTGDDKITLNCSVSQVTTTKFQLSINDNNGTAKVTMDFVKAK